jgi:uncharacterized membrane protein
MCIIGRVSDLSTSRLAARLAKPTDFGGMNELSTGTLVSLLLWLVILMGLVAAGWLIVRRFRDSNADDRASPNLGLTNLQEMAERGDISEKEYRTIKAVLGARLQQGIKDDKRKG